MESRRVPSRSSATRIDPRFAEVVDLQGLNESEGAMDAPVAGKVGGRFSWHNCWQLFKKKPSINNSFQKQSDSCVS